jgi:hypothetical protein
MTTGAMTMMDLAVLEVMEMMDLADLQTMQTMQAMEVAWRMAEAETVVTETATVAGMGLATKA